MSANSPESVAALVSAGAAALMQFKANADYDDYDRKVLDSLAAALKPFGVNEVEIEEVKLVGNYREEDAEPDIDALLAATENLPGANVPSKNVFVQSAIDESTINAANAVVRAVLDEQARMADAPDLDPDDPSICPVDNQPHHPDWKSLTIEHADGGSYLDVSCVKCGRSGCVGQAKTLADGIHW